MEVLKKIFLKYFRRIININFMDAKKLKKAFRRRNIVIPTLIGLGVAFYMIYDSFDESAFKGLTFSFQVVIFFCLAFGMILFRDIAYMFRLRLLSRKKIGWKKVFQDIMLWEFSSSITPSVVGGSAVAVFILYKEKLSLGKSTAIVMVTAFLDELFFIVMVPLLFVFFPVEQLFISGKLFDFAEFDFADEAKVIFITSYSLILLYTSFITTALFIFPRKFHTILTYFSERKFMSRWKNKIAKFANDIFTASKEMRGENFFFWAKAILTTFLSWTGRFWVVNFILLAALASSNDELLIFSEHLLVYARQLVMWIFMLISPTPGAAGVAELVFSNYLNEFTPIGLAATLGLIWRLVSYYLYIIVGVIVLPQWFKRIFAKEEFLTKE